MTVTYVDTTDVTPVPSMSFLWSESVPFASPDFPNHQFADRIYTTL